MTFSIMFYQIKKGEKRQDKCSRSSILKAQQSYCCIKQCLQSGQCLNRSDISACREKFWRLDEKAQRGYILTFFCTNAVKSKGRKAFVYLVEGKEVCNTAWLQSHGISKWR